MTLISSLEAVDHLQRTAVYLALIPFAYLSFKLIQRIHASLLGPLRHVPGPWLSRYTKLWEVAAVWRGDFEKQNIDLHKRHGKIVRLAPNKYSIDDPEAIRIIYGHGTKFVKTDFYSTFRAPEVTNLFAELDIKEHSGQRRRIASLYSMTNLLSYEGFIDKCTAILNDKFTQFSQKGKKVSIVDFLQFYAFDVIGAITAGNPFGLMSAEKDFDSIIHAIHRSLVYSGLVGLVPEIHPWLLRATKLLGLENPTAPVQNYIYNQINLRRQGVTPDDKNDFLTKLLKMEDAGPNTSFDTVNSISNNIGAGSDTTAITLSGCMYYLLRNPTCFAKLRKEIDDAVAAGKAADPITYSQAQDMPYLQATIKETLRCHAAVGYPLLRIVPAGGAVIAGTLFPEGVEVGVNPWVAHYNEDVWGKDAAQFRPERWLEASEAQLKRMEGYYLPVIPHLQFGHGSRTCIGKHISLLEITKVIPQMVRKFDFEFAEDYKDGWTTETRWFCKQKYECHIKPRAQ
ncbi:pisatin demethylase [Macrophomina phaseolina]|uniref:Pisatin demethylase n=1 Tax=Macrophomina phaseolina TaxID=35725 RepID=A0ABQ8GVG6_9PEZI|nr:pisatin demethylase [Macrophomina phaseolina]